MSKNPKDEPEECKYMDEIEGKFVRLKRGTKRYKDMLPLKCFNCRRIGHYALDVCIRKTTRDQVMVRRRIDTKEMTKTRS